MSDLLDRDSKRRMFRQVFARGNVGPRVLADLMEFAGIWNNSFLDNERHMERVAGQRDVIMYILDSMGISDDYEVIARALVRAPVRQPQPIQMEGDD